MEHWNLVYLHGFHKFSKNMQYQIILLYAKIQHSENSSSQNYQDVEF